MAIVTDCLCVCVCVCVCVFFFFRLVGNEACENS